VLIASLDLKCVVPAARKIWGAPAAPSSSGIDDFVMAITAAEAMAQHSVVAPLKEMRAKLQATL
jgi:hypothetical protein